jgi:hypothetical protein
MHFALTILSRAKFSEGDSDEALLKSFKTRFAALPLQHIDCVFLHSLGLPQVNEEHLSAVSQNEASQEQILEAQRSSGLKQNN